MQLKASGHTARPDTGMRRRRESELAAPLGRSGPRLSERRRRQRTAAAARAGGGLPETGVVGSLSTVPAPLRLSAGVPVAAASPLAVRRLSKREALSRSSSRPASSAPMPKLIQTTGRCSIRSFFLQKKGRRRGAEAAQLLLAAPNGRRGEN